MKPLFLLFPFLLMGISFIPAKATGPTYVASEIRPISINNRGDILCRTRFTINKNGGHVFMPVTYGFCVISNGKINEYPQITLQENYEAMEFDYDSLYAYSKKMDSIFYTVNHLKNLGNTGTQLKQKYGFSTYNVEPYKVDQVMSSEEFQQRYRLDLLQQSQITLKRVKNFPQTKLPRQIKVNFVIANVIFMQNEVGTWEGDEEAGIGWEFEFYSDYEFEDPEGNRHKAPIEISKITSILFKPKK